MTTIWFIALCGDRSKNDLHQEQKLTLKIKHIWLMITQNLQKAANILNMYMLPWKSNLNELKTLNLPNKGLGYFEWCKFFGKYNNLFRNKIIQLDVFLMAEAFLLFMINVVSKLLKLNGIQSDFETMMSTSIFKLVWSLGIYGYHLEISFARLSWWKKFLWKMDGSDFHLMHSFKLNKQSELATVRKFNI